MLTRAKRAFTLLELIVVIVILGILAALAIPTFAEVISRSEDQGAKTSAEAVARNAVAIAAFDNEAPSLHDVLMAVSEADGVSILEADNTALDSDADDDLDTDDTDAGVGGTTVVLDVDGAKVNVAFSAQKNGAATVTVP